jgi:signal transduction histidine kinase
MASDATGPEARTGTGPTTAAAASRAAALALARTRRARAQVVFAMLALASGAAALGIGIASSRPRLAALGGVALLVGAAVAIAALRRLAVSPAGPAPEIAFVADEAAQHARRLALLESQLDQAPVALWWHQGSQVAPLSNAARRLLAPGGASNRDTFLAQLRDAPASGSQRLVAFESERGTERCLIAVRPVLVAGEEARLVALMPVESELEAQTLHAWRQLVHVMTHEIMNSLTPIASLSRTAQEMLDERAAAAGRAPPSQGATASAPAQATDAAEADAARDADLRLALDAIARRAESLAVFVRSYRRVSEGPPPTLAPVSLVELFRRVERLVASEWTARGGSARFTVEPPSLTLMADAGQLEQALLNLVLNAAQATADRPAPALAVQARLLRGGRLAIEVRDNGPGAPAGRERDMFLPFFSTREGGSGIGLAVVRTLVQGMGGSVRYARPPGGGACFLMTF